MRITDAVAEFISLTDATSIPAAAREQAQRALLDTLGVSIAGMTEPAPHVVMDLIAQQGARGDITILASEQVASAPDAALVNGTAAHALDFDDTHECIGHPSAPVVPAALAVGELVEASGADLLTAFLVGVEVECKVGRAMHGMRGSHQLRGFHNTSTTGVLGAAAAAARLLRLDVEQTKAALAIAASSASGLRQNFGTMTKPFHVGHAAHDGVVAAMLARSGFTGSDAIFDGPLSFTRVLSPDGDDNPELISGFAERWEICDPGVGVKKYPCCYAGHPAVDAVLTLADRHSVRPQDVAKVEVHLARGEVDANGGVGPMIYPRPVSGLEGKFSMQYVVAAALLDGKLSLETFTDEQVLRPDVRQLMERVVPVEDVEREPDRMESLYTEVAVQLRGGDTFTERVLFPRGDAAGGDPLSWSELEQKYRDCAAVLLSPARVEASLEMIAEIDSVPNVRDLLKAFTATAASPSA